jgi:predicted nucleotidyltransferase
MIPISESVASAVASVLGNRTGESVVAAWLFGSYAESRAHRESDVDIGVLLDRDRLPTSRDRFEEGLALTSLLLAAVAPRQPDLVIVNDVPPGLASRIVTTGKLLLCRNAEAEHAFRRDVQLRAADLEPFLRRLRRVKLDAISR